MRFSRQAACSFVLACAITTPALAQAFPIARGVWQVGGTATLSATDGGHTTRVLLFPQIGRFVRRGVALTFVAPLGYQTSGSEHIWTYGVGPGIGYYWGGPRQHVFPYLAASARWVWNRVEGAPSGGATSHDQVLRTAGGLAAMLARNVAITGELYYQTDRFGFVGSNTITSTSYGLDFGIAVFLY